MADTTDDYCYLTTTGRRSGRPHTIEIWYADARGATTLYLLAGTGAAGTTASGMRRSDWVRNLQADPVCTVRIGSRDAPLRDAHGRVLEADADEADVARHLVYEKFQPRYGGDLTDWRDHAIPVAIDLL